MSAHGCTGVPCTICHPCCGSRYSFNEFTPERAADILAQLRQDIRDGKVTFQVPRKSVESDPE